MKSENTSFQNSLRFRFGIWTASLLFVVLVIFSAFVLLNTKRSLERSIDETLRFNATQALTSIEVEGGVIELPDGFFEGQQTDELRAQGYLIRTLDAAGNVLHSVGSYSDLPVSAEAVKAALVGDPHLATLIDPLTGRSVRLYSRPIPGGAATSGVYQVGQSLAAVDETVRSLLRTLMIAGPALVLAAGAGGYLLAARALQPIDEISATADRISAYDLSERIAVGTTYNEVTGLASTFNAMLKRLESAFRRERQFTADASHELRTPLTAIQSILDVTQDRPRSGEEYRESLADLDAENTRLIGLAEGLLMLARHDGGRETAHTSVDLSQLLLDVTDSMRSLARSKGLELERAWPQGLAVFGDSDQLVRLAANLTDNSIKYSESGTILISGDRSGSDWILVTVADEGLGIPSEDLPHVFERFYRADRSRSSNGAGLGLAIAQRIVLAHNGSIEITSEEGLGTTVSVTLTAAKKEQA